MRLIRSTPNESHIRQQIAEAQEELASLNAEVAKVRNQPDYIGREGFRKIQRLEAQFGKQQHLYWLRKRACFDLIEVFSELHQIDQEVFKQ